MHQFIFEFMIMKFVTIGKSNGLMQIVYLQVLG